MKSDESTLWALYGGAGFIGQHLALSILQRFPQDRVYLLDIQSPSEIFWKVPLDSFLDSGRLEVQECDVRDSVSLRKTACDFDVIVNLAAILREPGHRREEYFETNVAGAQNVCGLADHVGCKEVIFTSSIAVYGIHDRPADEDSTPKPRTPYGQSKREAEVIHQEWAKRTGGRLSIIRPGVVFGPGEEGNAARLVREMLKRKRVIRVKPDHPKAGIYIAELVDVFHWLRNQPLPKGDSQLVNGVSDEVLTFNAIGRVLKQMKGLDRYPLSIPGKLLGFSTTLMNPLAGLFPGASKFHPQRLAKLVLTNDVRPTTLVRMGYTFTWPLERAMADWLEKGI